MKKKPAVEVLSPAPRDMFDRSDFACRVDAWCVKAAEAIRDRDRSTKRRFRRFDLFTICREIEALGPEAREIYFAAHDRLFRISTDVTGAEKDFIQDKGKNGGPEPHYGIKRHGDASALFGMARFIIPRPTSPAARAALEAEDAEEAALSTICRALMSFVAPVLNDPDAKPWTEGLTAESVGEIRKAVAELETVPQDSPRSNDLGPWRSFDLLAKELPILGKDRERRRGQLRRAKDKGGEGKWWRRIPKETSDSPMIEFRRGYVARLFRLFSATFESGSLGAALRQSKGDS